MRVRAVGCLEAANGLRTLRFGTGPTAKSFEPLRGNGASAASFLTPRASRKCSDAPPSTSTGSREEGIRHQPVHSWVLQDAYRNRNSFGWITGHREPCASHAVVQLSYRYDLPFRPRSAQVTGLGRKIVLSDLYCFPFHIGWRGLASSLPLGLGSLRSRSARLSTESNLLRHLAPLLGVVGSHQGVVSCQPPPRAVLFHRQSVAS